MTLAEQPVAAETSESSLLQIRGLKKYFPVTKGLLFSRTTGHLKAVDGISFDVERGKTLGIVGESGVRQEYHCQAAFDAGGTH